MQARRVQPAGRYARERLGDVVGRVNDPGSSAGLEAADEHAPPVRLERREAADQLRALRDSEDVRGIELDRADEWPVAGEVAMAQDDAYVVDELGGLSWDKRCPGGEELVAGRLGRDREIVGNALGRRIDREDVELIHAERDGADGVVDVERGSGAAIRRTASRALPPASEHSSGSGRA